MRRRWVVLFSGLVLMALIAAIWVPAALAGPTIDCGGMEQAECDEAVPVVIKDATGWVPLAALMPVTSVRLFYNPSCPLGYYVTWIFGFSASYSGLC